MGLGSALLGMVLRGKRRYGGYLVHIGIMLMFIGWAGSAYQSEKTAKLGPGQSVKVGAYTIRFDKLAHEEDRQKEMVTGELTALVNGKEYDRPRPAKWFFHNHESEPTTEVAIKRAPAEDLYITLGNYDLAEGTATLKIVINPVVDWIWFGFMLLAIATGIVLIPDSVLERVMTAAPVPAAAAARSAGVAGIALWLALGAGGALMLSPRPAAAQMRGGGAEAPEPASDDERWLVRNIVCQCGSCRHMLIECESEGCGHAIQDRLAIRELLNRGQKREQIVEYFIQKYGGQIALAAPLNRGFNRLAWMFPYAVAAVAAGGLGYGAYRLAKRPPAKDTAPTEASISDPELADKLDDELRNLD